LASNRNWRICCSRVLSMVVAPGWSGRGFGKD
jgi:hypothetical protein